MEYNGEAEGGLDPQYVRGGKRKVIRTVSKRGHL